MTAKPETTKAGKADQLITPHLDILFTRNKNENRANSDYIAHKLHHRHLYNPVTRWYEWQPEKHGRQRLCRQNDMAYAKYVNKIPGLHEQHLAEELHRYSIFPAQYTDYKGTVSVDPSVPPMGDPFKFHGTSWPGKRFDDMWIYWTQLYPAHAHDIEVELVLSKKEVRKAWWDVKLATQQWTRRPRCHKIEQEGIRQLEAPTPPQVKEGLNRRKHGHFELTYLDNPCRVCGGIDHPALKVVEDPYGVVSYSYVCQMAVVHDWETTCMRPCPQKMARLCQYDEEEVDGAVTRMIIDGWGQFQSNRVIKQFLKTAKQFCQSKGILIKEGS